MILQLLATLEMTGLWQVIIQILWSKLIKTSIL